MKTRGTIALAALLFAAAAPSTRTSAQVRAPRLVEDGDEAPADEAPAPTRPAREPEPGRPGRPPALSLPPPPAPAAAPAAAAGAAAGPAEAAKQGVPGQPLPPPPPPPATASELARRIVPVRSSYPKLMALFAERHRALREADSIRAEEAEKALLAAKADLAIENLFLLAAVEVREARRALGSNLASEAVSHARAAAALAPDLPDAHLTLARALLAERGSPGPALASVGDALAAAAREPHTVRAFVGDVASAALAAALVAAVLSVLIIVLRRLRLFLHDFHHLPLLRGTAKVQSGFLGLVLVASPLAFGLGAVPAVLVALAAVWLYLSLSERIVATLSVAVLVAAPWCVGAAARAAAWTGSVAETVYDLEHGAVSDEQAAGIRARFADASAPAPIYAALGRYEKRRGNLDEALRLYRRALDGDPHAAELLVNEGNVLFLKDDLEGAKAAYLGATDRAGGDVEVLGAAHYNLSKLYLRTTDMNQSASAREKAEREAGEFLKRYGSDEDFSANRYLVDVPVPGDRIRALAAEDGAPQAIASWAERRLAGAVPRSAWPVAPLALVAALWLFGLAGSRLRPARACERCGGPACPRCDPAAGDLCGQCLNVFVRSGLVEARDRLRKEAAVRRRHRLVSFATRALAIVGCGAGQLFNGAPAKGALLLCGTLFAAFLIWFWRGVLPPPQPSPYALLGKLAVAVPVGLGLWALAVRDAFRRTE